MKEKYNYYFAILHDQVDKCIEASEEDRKKFIHEIGTGCFMDIIKELQHIIY